MKRSLFLLILVLPAGCREQTALPLPAGEGPVEPVAVAPFAMGRPDVVLLVTGGTNGRLEYVSCCGVMPGGLSRRSGVFRSYEAAFPHTLRIDTGDFFSSQPADVCNEFVVRGCRTLGYDVMVLGDQEWSAGPARLARLLGWPALPWARSGRPSRASESNEEPVERGVSQGGPTWLSTTVRPAGGQPGVPITPAFRKEWPGVKLAFVSDAPLDPAYVSVEQSDKIAFAPAGEPSRLARELKAQGYVVVLIPHLREEEIGPLVQAAQPDLVLRGHASRSDANVLRLGAAPVLKVGGGDYVGVVAMKIEAGRLAALEYRVEILDDHWPVDDRMVRLYQAYTRAASVQSLDAGRTSPVEYVAPGECGRCHAKQYEFWKATGHANAYATLVREKRQDDPDCLTCHTTGLGQPGGFEPASPAGSPIGKTPQHANVNCQECHRFGVQEHRAPAFKPQPVPPGTCDSCHNRLNSSIEERYEEMRKEVACPKN